MQAHGTVYPLQGTARACGTDFLSTGKKKQTLSRTSLAPSFMQSWCTIDGSCQERDGGRGTIMTFVRNAWYAASWASELAHTLKHQTILGEDVVLYRTLGGRPLMFC